ncbi:hypothetical protein JCGZ_03372 [Jatropha curcas]|uniref:Uncharacterized protein n=1 Tax=Jatropha curcas TaxID=180498 RepID=A0A067JD11_JATCU|nr:protein EARLY RESPONSIVE TO DEHYDRATION 15 [Jatropha curcas]KDP21701.1 hypothetical protein JCGZ_03372 [Jatropha curcas]
MEVISHTSTLNPNAPLFVPMAYRSVEDFSDQWWSLVHSSPSFRDYWLEECFTDPQIDPLHFNFFDEVDVDSLFCDCVDTKQAVEMEEKEHSKDLVSIGVMKWQKGRAQVAQVPKYVEKAPRIVSVRVSPRTIQQPR